MKQWLLNLLSLALTLACAIGEEVRITILHTTDLHANILPTTDYEGNPDRGGAARCAAMIKKIRSETPNVLVVDAGDLYQGTALGYLTDGSAMTRTLNHLRYDAWTLGNHEFDWGIEKLTARIAEAEIPVLAANLQYEVPPAASPGIGQAIAKVKPFAVREISGVKIGMVGLTSPGIPNWSRPRLIPGIRIESSIPALRRVLPQMKAAGCRVLVLVTHQGIHEGGDDHANQLYAVSEAFPELDVIIGGHTHAVRPEQMIHGILYSQAGYWGGHLGRVDLTWDTVQQKLISRRANALPMDTSVAMDPELLGLLKADLDRTVEHLETRIGETTELLHPFPGPNKETPVFNLICSAIAEMIHSHGGQVDGVLHGILSATATVKPGPVAMRDIYELVPYENTIGVATLTRDELVEILEENATSYQTRRFRGLWGMTMKLAPSAPKGRQVVFVGSPDGTALRPDAQVRVAFNSFDLASGGNRWRVLRRIVDQPQAQLKEYDFQTRDAVAGYIGRHSPLNIGTNGWWSLEKSRK